VASTSEREVIKAQEECYAQPAERRIMRKAALGFVALLVVALTATSGSASVICGVAPNSLAVLRLPVCEHAFVTAQGSA
jgi:hypothetical protein